jgi:hypothetical protein
MSTRAAIIVTVALMLALGMSAAALAVALTHDRGSCNPTPQTRPGDGIFVPSC